MNETTINFNGDLHFGQKGENHLKNILESVEVKTDRATHATGNVAVELEYRGKPSGLATSNAKYWAFVFAGEYKGEVIILIERERLKNVVKDGNFRTVYGGDDMASKLVLIPKEKLL